MAPGAVASDDNPAVPADANPFRNSIMADSASDDPFLRQFFAQLPPELRTNFTDRQLAALKSVFGDATRSGHAFDLRFSLPLPWRGIYLVLLGGQDRRRGGAHKRSGARRGLWRLGNLIVGGLFVLQIGLALAGLVIWLIGD